MNPAKQALERALANTAEAFSLPVSLVEAIANAYYDQKELDAGAQLVLARYQKELSDFIGPIVAQWASDAAKRDREKNAGDRGSGSSTKSPTKNRPNKQSGCASGFCARG